MNRVANLLSALVLTLAACGPASDPAFDTDRCPTVCQRFQSLCGATPPGCESTCSALETTAQDCVISSTSCEEASACGSSGGSGGGGASGTGGTGGAGDTSGSGGTGGAGGTGGGSGTTKPTELTVTGAFNARLGTTAVLSQDKTTLYTTLSGEAKPVTYTPAWQDSPDLSRATISVISPALGNCPAKPTLTTSWTSRNVTLSFTGGDRLPSTACSDWAKAVKAQGLIVEYGGASWRNGGPLNQVRLELAP